MYPTICLGSLLNQETLILPEISYILEISLRSKIMKELGSNASSTPEESFICLSPRITVAGLFSLRKLKRKTKCTPKESQSIVFVGKTESAVSSYVSC